MNSIGRDNYRTTFMHELRDHDISFASTPTLIIVPLEQDYNAQVVFGPDRITVTMTQGATYSYVASTLSYDEHDDIDAAEAIIDALNEWR